MSMLTNTKAKALKPNDAPLPDGTVVGLRLKPSIKAGQGKWELRFTSPVLQKRRDMGLGKFPDISIAEARKRGAEAHQKIAVGLDPIAERERQRATIRSVGGPPTFEQAARKRFEEIKPGFSDGKHVDQWINTLATYVFPHLGAQLVTDLKAKDFAAVLKPIWLDKPETARRVKQRCNSVMESAMAHDWIEVNVVASVGALLPKQSSRPQHHAAMPWKKVPDFVEGLTMGASVALSRKALVFIILTAARSGEVRQMVWEEVDLQEGVWTIPANRMKARVLHSVPLSKPALTLLGDLRKDGAGQGIVFPSRNGTSLSDTAISKHLKGLSLPSDRPGKSPTVHGFRTSFRNWASENSYSRDLAERALAHAIKNEVEAAYHRTDLLEQRAPMMQAWADHVTKVAL